MNTLNTLTVSDAANRLKMPERQIRRYCAKGLVGKKLGRDWILLESELPILERFKGRPAGNSPKWKNGKEPEKKARKSGKITNS